MLRNRVFGKRYLPQCRGRNTAFHIRGEWALHGDSLVVLLHRAPESPLRLNAPFSLKVYICSTVLRGGGGRNPDIFGGKHIWNAAYAVFLYSPNNWCQASILLFAKKKKKKSRSFVMTELPSLQKTASRKLFAPLMSLSSQRSRGFPLRSALLSPPSRRDTSTALGSLPEEFQGSHEKSSPWDA